MVPRAVLIKSGLVSVNTARQVNAAHSKTIVNSARPKSHFSKPAHLTVKRPIHKNTTFKNSNFNQRVNTIRNKNVNTVRPKAVVNAARPKAVLNAVKRNHVNAIKASACWIQVSNGLGPQKKLIFLSNVQGNPQMVLPNQGVIDSGCSRNMTGNMSYLTNFKEIDGGYVAFIGNPKGGKITSRGLGYTAIPPPYTRNFMPLKPDLSFSGLKVFISEPIVIKPVAEKSEAKASEAKSKAVRKNNCAPIFKDWVSDNEDDMPQAKIEKKTFKPNLLKIEFCQTKQQEKKTARKKLSIRSF
ncbi:hypothetical protein Tco_1506192 [Tanacetum coccineum]